MKEAALIKKLQNMQQKFDKIECLITQSYIISNYKKYVLLTRKYKKYKEILEVYKNYNIQKDIISEATHMLKEENDIETCKIIEIEKNIAFHKANSFKKEIQFLLTPKDPEYDKNAIVELRAGTGGDEACIFVEDILRMYTMYFKEKNWSFEILNAQSANIKGYKEIILHVKGLGVYGSLKFESGVHRVQRIPKTESQGRIHTSAITVAILPEIQNVDLKINSIDIKRETFRSSGAGGQHVNKIESAVRLTYIPKSIVVECQEERSQHKNFDKAMTILRSRIYQSELNYLNKERANIRKSLVSTGDRSVKIRTYNYIKGRVTDHRIKKSIYSLEEFMNGNIQEMIDSLKIVEKLNEEDNLEL